MYSEILAPMVNPTTSWFSVIS